MLLLLPGLVASYLCRRMKWGAAAWMPTLLCFGYAVHDVISQPIGWFPQITILPSLVVLVIGCCACAFGARPRGPGLRLANFASALAVTVLAAAAYEWHMRETITVLVTDEAGNPIPETRAEYTLGWNTTIKGRGEALSDQAGRISLQSRRGWSQHMYLTPMADYSQDPDRKPQSIGLGIDRPDRLPGTLEVYRGWRNHVGTATFDEAYSELMPYVKSLTLPVTLYRAEQIVSPLRRDKIRAAFERVSDYSENDLSYPDVCRNLEAVDFIPEMIALWTARREHRQSLVTTMGWLAESLDKADRGCAKLQQTLDRPADSDGGFNAAGIRAEIVRLREWAGIPDDGASPDRRQIEEVRDFIRARARALLDFAMQFAETDEGARKVLGDLGSLARPVLPDLVARLLKQPPPDMRAALGWSSVFFRLRATESELKDLIGSGNPMLQTAARAARPDKK